MTAGTTQQANVEQAVPLFAVSSMAESLHFYVDGLGFVMSNQWVPEGRLKWCWLQLGGAALMLQEYRTEGHDSWTPKGPVGEGVSLNFVCRDALAIYHDVGGRGIPAARKPFVGNHMWVVQFTDPDGYQVFFESATDVPEETEYVETPS